MVLFTPIFAVAFLLIVIAPISLYYAWAGSILWGWFVVPVFGAPPLTTLHVWGICLFLSMLRPRVNMAKSDTEGWESGLFALLLAPLLSLGIGYAIKFWWMT